MVGSLLILAGLGNALRLARWRPLSTRGDPLLWVLHLGYAWLALGLAFLGVDVLRGTYGQHLHALTAGCFATMVLAVMTRATLGHTGRELSANRATTAAYLLVSLGALARVAAHAFPAAYGAAATGSLSASPIRPRGSSIDVVMTKRAEGASSTAATRELTVAKTSLLKLGST